MGFHMWNMADKEKNEKISTDELFQQIQEDPSGFEKNCLDSLETFSFDGYLKDLMNKYEITASQLINRSLLSKPFVYQILRGERVPGRDMILRISLAMKADMNDTQHLLMGAGKGILYPKVRRDAAILCCIESGKSLEDTNLFLKKLGEKELL